MQGCSAHYSTSSLPDCFKEGRERVDWKFAGRCGCHLKLVILENDKSRFLIFDSLCIISSQRILNAVYFVPNKYKIWQHGEQRRKM